MLRDKIQTCGPQNSSGSTQSRRSTKWRWTKYHRSIAFVTAIVSMLSVGYAALAESQVDFQTLIRPILVDHCFQCHGPDPEAREAELRLDIRELAIADRDSGDIAIVPGRPETSELVQRVMSANPDEVMPPPSQKNPLTTEQAALLQRWIAEGANYARHWAFTVPRQTTVPEVTVAGFVARNPIDKFVAVRLQREGLAMSPPAGFDMLCRRISLDLIGLPPSPNEVDEFTMAARKDLPGAVKGLVDRLLDCQQFGEKWARHWLDVARYADSNGYEKDMPRQQWAWRDWVIQAINRDMPYDQFIFEQIAGDMLPDRTQDQLVATGFLRNGMINEEGAIIPEEFRMEGMYDRMDTIGKAVLGLSVQCAQCHSHKFDPITQAEYYGMFAFVNNTYESQSWVYTREQQTQMVQIQADIAAVEKQLKQDYPDWAEQLARWETLELERQRVVEWQVLKSTDLHCKSELNHPTSLHDHSIVTLGHSTSDDDIYVTAEPNLERVTGLRFEILTYGDLPYGGPGRNYKGTWALTELIVEAKPTSSDKWKQIKLKNVTADFSEPEHTLEPEWKRKPDTENKNDDENITGERRTCGPAGFLADGKDETAWRADRGAGRRNTDSVAVAQFEEPVNFPSGTQLRFSIRTKHGGDIPKSFDQGPKNTMIGRFRISLTTSPDPVTNNTSYAAVLALRTRPRQRSPEQHAQIFAAWRESVPEFKLYTQQIETIWNYYPEAPTSVLTLAERKGHHTRPTFRLDRGRWDHPLERVQSHVPASLHPLPENATNDRITFANWLVDKRSPLTARVQVNRVWQAIFGAGLVRTPEDFGMRAPQPEYRELLDWLAVDYMDRGWSLKELVRMIVSSATYQQDSRVARELLQHDPDNRLLARGPRFRLEAEVLRDLALSVSGLLHQQTGGRSTFPPVPQSVIDYNYIKPEYWIPPEGSQRYRRALYLFRKRSMPDPVLTTFDAPNADISCAQRARSNTPLAALVSLNETIFIEAARALAIRILREGGSTDAERTSYVFRLCTGRIPRSVEAAEILALLNSRRRQIAEGHLSVNEIITGNPETRPKLSPEVAPLDVAVWTISARVLLNLDETITKN